MEKNPFNKTQDKREKLELVDKKVQNHKDPFFKDSFSKFYENAESADKNITKDSEGIGNLTEVLDNFLKTVIEEKPDYIVLFDKGARLFGVPFNSFLSKLAIKRPKIIFWNSGLYKNLPLDIKGREINELWDKNKQLHNKKIFFVDETFHSGNNASMIQNLFNDRDVDGKYFALSQTYIDDYPKSISSPEADKFKKDERFVLYPFYIEGDLFTKKVADMYVANDENHNTVRRFKFENQETETREDIAKKNAFLEGNPVWSSVKQVVREELTRIKCNKEYIERASNEFSYEITEQVIKKYKDGYSLDSEDLKKEILFTFYNLVQRPTQDELQNMSDVARETRKKAINYINSKLEDLYK